jgi:hypothetical protein
MKKWLNKTIDKHRLSIIWICIIFLVLIFFWNFFTNKKGSYTDYNQLINEIFSKPVNNVPNNFLNTKIIKEKKNYESNGEKECRRVLEKLTNKKFIKARPDFLKNNVTGHNLELDCFNEELKLAVEYNGIQHYEFTPRFHSSKDAFFNSKYRDLMKKELCEQNNIKLIIVPYTVKIDQIENYLKTKIMNI